MPKRALLSHLRECDPVERKFAELFTLYRNKTRAYRETTGDTNQNYRSVAAMACQMFARPWVERYARELEIEAAKAVGVDREALIARDLAILNGYAHASDLMRIERQCCRRCYGKGHKYQYRDDDEYYLHVATTVDENATRSAPLPLPSDEGGYGFNPHREPHIACPNCEGNGVQVTYFADTNSLEGPAAVLFKGVKETKNGIEILTHDADKAAERLYRATGMYGDDAASAAKGAAAGAAIGAAAAQHLAEKVKTMTTEEKRKAYLQLVS